MYNNLMVKRKRYVRVSGIVRREGKRYTAWCPELDVSTFGDSVDEASRNLGDAVELYLDTTNKIQSSFGSLLLCITQGRKS